MYKFITLMFWQELLPSSEGKNHQRCPHCWAG